MTVWAITEFGKVVSPWFSETHDAYAWLFINRPEVEEVGFPGVGGGDYRIVPKEMPSGYEVISEIII